MNDLDYMRMALELAERTAEEVHRDAVEHHADGCHHVDGQQTDVLEEEIKNRIDSDDSQKAIPEDVVALAMQAYLLDFAFSDH